jgi:catechol 2,3-dioxygenase-like lactoylglutathione lyase family enzyme
MIRVTTVNLWVHDQDEALAFYTEKLGWELRADVTLPEIPGYRWLTVGPAAQDDFQVVLNAIPGPPMFEPETSNMLRELMSRGVLGSVMLATDDIYADVEALKARGVEFAEEPEERPYGIDSAVRDPSGNLLRLTQVKENLVSA